MTKKPQGSPRGAPAIYPFRTMNKGEEFFIPDANPTFPSYVYHRGKALDRKFTCEQTSRGGKRGMLVTRVG